jgi:hypothetical protein
VLDDPLQISQPDPHPDSERWKIAGIVGPVLLLGVHTWPGDDPDTGEADGPDRQRPQSHGARKESV